MNQPMVYLYGGNILLIYVGVRSIMWDILLLMNHGLHNNGLTLILTLPSASSLSSIGSQPAMAQTLRHLRICRWFNRGDGRQLMAKAGGKQFQLDSHTHSL